MRTALLLAVTTLLATSFTPQAPTSAQREEDPSNPATSLGDEHAGFIFFAVLEGLYVDGVPNDIVDVIVERDPQTNQARNFVYACPICTPAFDAFQVYRARVPFSGRKVPCDTFGEGLPEALQLRLRSPDTSLRLKAIEELVQGWIQRRVKAMRWTPEELQHWSIVFQERRKIGMNLLTAYRAQDASSSYAQMKECAFCNAANGACGR